MNTGAAGVVREAECECELRGVVNRMMRASPVYK